MTLENEQYRQDETSRILSAVCAQDRPSSSSFNGLSLPASAQPHPEFEQSAVTLLELENRGLRRLIVELLHKNQQLRERIDAA